jgi:hypothetical protein
VACNLHGHPTFAALGAKRLGIGFECDFDVIFVAEARFTTTTVICAGCNVDDD